MTIPLLAYISAPYTADTHEQIEANIQAARKVAIEVWQAGHYALCPNLNCAHFEVDCTCSYEQYIDGDLIMLSRCDCIVMLPGWEKSRGCKAEYVYAVNSGIPVFIYTDRLPALNTTPLLRLNPAY